MTDVMFKNVDDYLLREFKAEAVREGKTFGQALTEAFATWLESRKSTAGKKLRLSSLKPMDFGKGSERGSVDVDKIVYG